MKIAVIKEREPEESRVALTPDVAKQYIKNNFEVWVEAGAGVEAGFTDSDYAAVGVKVSKVPLEILSDADIILKVRPTPLKEKVNETEFAKKNALVIGILNPYSNSKLLDLYKHKELSALSMELVPRTTKAQSMDVLSSQANLAGYRAVIEACNELKKALPMFMTAAGTVQPAKVLVLGAGVAGLQAIATAKRMGAVVSALDARQAAKEQVESVGGKFLSVDTTENFETKGGYAKEVSDDYKVKQQILLAEQLKIHDIVITTAQIPGKSAPQLITKSMIAAMKPGSVIVDLAASSGGNCEGTELDKVVEYKNIKLIGYGNLPSRIAYDSSRLYAKNLYNLIMYLFDNGKKKELNIDDDIAKAILITHNGKVLFNKN
ncbi:MAG: pntA1 [Rickettsiaceae bacterium]|jgi:NAD(P) transhydrogenase subunit alpha|nr:pntA1 [Rickettsiaceae bacterium]